jgi:hypothetical protein
MSYTVRFLPELEEDVLAAHDWYEGKAVGLGAEFLRVFYARDALLQRTPLTFPKVHQNFHRGLLRRFPYACYFLIEGNFIIVYGVFHCARNPAFVKNFIAARYK